MKRFWRWSKPGRAIWEFYKKKKSQSVHTYEHVNVILFRDRGMRALKEANVLVSRPRPCSTRTCRLTTGALLSSQRRTSGRWGEDLVTLRRTSSSMTYWTGRSGHTWEAQRSRSRSRQRFPWDCFSSQDVIRGVCTFTQMTFPPLSNVRRTNQVLTVSF